MKRKNSKLEEILRLPPEADEEMQSSLARVKALLRSTAALKPTPVIEEPVGYPFLPSSHRWANTAIFSAATLLIAAVLGGIVWYSTIYGVLDTPDGGSHWVYEQTAFGDGGGVLTLRDGSRVEIREMSDVSLQRAADGVRIWLTRGAVIVDAAKQRQGHLYVQTKDMTVSVVNTVFFVNTEDAGSRVAVLEGEVQVQQGATGKQLRPGDQVATNPDMRILPVRDEISWSSDADRHMALWDHARTGANSSARGPDEPEWQRAAGGRMSFEAATVRPGSERDPAAFPLTIDNVFRSTGGVFKASLPLRYYIEFAYKLSLTPAQREAFLAQAPKWVETENVAINAKAPTSNPTKDQMRLMLQSLLAERFKLAAHFEHKTVPVFALTLLKAGTLGPQIRPHAEGPPCPAKRAESDLFPLDVDAGVWPYTCDATILIRPGVAVERLRPANKTSANSQLLAGRNVSLEVIIDAFMRSGIGMGTPVVNQTGLSGEFDFSLEWTTDDATTMSLPEAVRDQLGMKIEQTKLAVPVLIVEHVEKPSDN